MSLEISHGQHANSIPCFTGNIGRALLMRIHPTGVKQKGAGKEGVPPESLPNGNVDQCTGRRVRHPVVIERVGVAKSIAVVTKSHVNGLMVHHGAIVTEQIYIQFGPKRQLNSTFKYNIHQNTKKNIQRKIRSKSS